MRKLIFLRIGIAVLGFAALFGRVCHGDDQPGGPDVPKVQEAAKASRQAEDQPEREPARGLWPARSK